MLLGKFFQKKNRLVGKISSSAIDTNFFRMMCRIYLKRDRERIRSRGWLPISKSANTACLALVVCRRLSSANAHTLFLRFSKKYNSKASLFCSSLVLCCSRRSPRCRPSPAPCGPHPFHAAHNVAPLASSDAHRSVRDLCPVPNHFAFVSAARKVM
jgi:hypothetical protein